MLGKTIQQTEFLRKEFEQSFNVNLSESSSLKNLVKMLQTELDAKFALHGDGQALSMVETLEINDANPMEMKVLLVKQNKQIDLLSQQLKIVAEEK